MGDETSEKSNLIITLVQGFPHLYDKKDPSYKDAQKKENSWRTIAEMVEMSVHDCQTRWKSLRDRYCREKKKLDAPSGSGVILSESAKELIRNMNFLETIVHHRKSAGNYSNTCSEAAVSYVENTEPSSQSNVRLISIDSPQPSTSGIYELCLSSHRIVTSDRSILRIQSPKASPIPVTARSAMCVAPPLISPAANPSPSPPESVDAIGSPINRLRTTSSSDKEESSLSSTSLCDPSFDEELYENAIRVTGNNDLSVRAKSTKSKNHRLKRIRNEDVNAALIGALSSLSEMKKTKRSEPPRADQLFAETLVAELQRFPPRKKTLQLISQHDETEL